LFFKKKGVTFQLIENMSLSVLHKEPKVLLDEVLQSSKNDGFSEVVLGHIGEMHQDLINSLTEKVEEYMISSGDKKPTIKRSFSILIEGLQNVFIHGARISGEQASLLAISKNDYGYRISMGNYILNENISKISSRIEHLNKLSEDEVKEHYMEILNNGEISDKGGAGLGFITIRMKAKAKIQFHVAEVIEDVSFFMFYIDIERS
jgi:hypothetical protein